jgi:hypothetical protein
MSTDIKIGEGVPLPAKFEDIIEDLFENEKIKITNDSRLFVLFSKVKLTEQQKKTLTYPAGVNPIDFYIMYQTDQIDKKGNINLLSSQMVSFAKKDDGFIYGYYFNLINQKRLCYDKLTASSKEIKLCDDVEIINDNYVEVYNNVFGTTVILGLSTGTTTEVPSASLQYSHKCKYFYELLKQNGIQTPNYPKTRLIGLSKNLEICD